MEVRTNLGKFWEGQVQSGRKRRGSVRTKGAFPGSGLPYHYPGSCYPESYYLISRRSTVVSLFPDVEQMAVALCCALFILHLARDVLFKLNVEH
jgi:hypothetical protein